MASEWPTPIEGGCGCRRLRYKIEQTPLFVHCCNCHQCQRETGSAFVLNAMIETDNVALLPSAAAQASGGLAAVTKPILILTPSESGNGQLIARCPHCFVAVWSYYAGAGPYVVFVRAGTLDKQSVDGSNIEGIPRPDIYIFAKFKQPWVLYPEEARQSGLVCEEYYDRREKWPSKALERMERIRPLTQGWKSRGSLWEEIGDIVDCR